MEIVIVFNISHLEDARGRKGIRAFGDCGGERRGCSQGTGVSIQGTGIVRNVSSKTNIFATPLGLASEETKVGFAK